MSKIVLCAASALALAVAAVAVAGSNGSTHFYRATLTPGAEVPKPKAPAGAGGLLTATVRETGSTRTIRWKLTFRRLTGKAIAAHIHQGGAGVAGAVIVPLCGPCRSGQTGQAKISKAVAGAFEHGRTYVNVHTARNPGGEIRGQIKLLAHGATATTTTTPPPAQPDPTTTPDPGYGGQPPGY